MHNMTAKYQDRRSFPVKGERQGKQIEGLERE